MEEWRNVPGYENYLMVSSRGNVWRKWRPRGGATGPRPRPGIAKQSTRTTGHKFIGVKVDGQRFTLSVHRMVAEAFISRPDNTYEVCHFNDIPSDNRVSNLYWGTKATNASDAVRNGRNYWSKQTHCIRGHEFSEDNTFLAPSDSGKTKRVCVTCRRDYNREYMRTRRAKALTELLGH